MDDFRVTDEELQSFQKALRKKEFRDLLTEYVKEIQDPESRKRYEAGIIAMEKLRGEDVTFLNPRPGFVVRVFLEPGHRKVFVNVCQSEIVAEATCGVSKTGSKKKRGAEWNIPYSLTPGRGDLDKSGKRCLVYDCVFHPKTYQRAQKNSRFMQVLVDTTMEAVEEREEGKVATDKVKFLKMPYKGATHPTIVRETGHKKSKKRGGVSPSTDDMPFGVIYPPLPTHKTGSSKHKQHKKRNGERTHTSSPPSFPPEPSYVVKYRGEVAMGDYTNDRVSHAIKRPKEIVVTMELPGVSSAADVELDVLEKQLLLENKAPPYHLDLVLSYPVDTNMGKAKFDKAKKCLTVTLPILPPSPPPSLTPESTNHNSESESCDKGSQSGDEATNHIASPEPTSEHRLITELSTDKTEDSTVAQSQADMTSPDNSTNHDTDVHSSTSPMIWMSRGEWSAPQFSYRQDDERVVFVLHSTNVKTQTLVHHSDEHQFQVMYSCVEGGSKQPVNRSFLVRFHVNDLVNKTEVDVSRENMVVIVTKSDSCRRMWAWFEAGANSQSTERKLFLTEANVESAVEDLKRWPDPWNTTSGVTEVKVTSSSSELLELELNTQEKPMFQLDLNKEEDAVVDQGGKGEVVEQGDGVADHVLGEREQSLGQNSGIVDVSEDGLGRTSDDCLGQSSRVLDVSGEGLGQTSDYHLVPSEVKSDQDPKNPVQNGIKSGPNSENQIQEMGTFSVSPVLNEDAIPMSDKPLHMTEVENVVEQSRDPVVWNPDHPTEMLATQQTQARNGDANIGHTRLECGRTNSTVIKLTNELLFDLD